MLAASALFVKLDGASLLALILSSKILLSLCPLDMSSEIDNAL